MVYGFLQTCLRHHQAVSDLFEVVYLDSLRVIMKSEDAEYLHEKIHVF
jgi:hypothetical protein